MQLKAIKILHSKNNFTKIRCSGENYFSRSKREKMDFFHSFLNHARNVRFSTRFSGTKKGPFRAHVKRSLSYFLLFVIIISTFILFDKTSTKTAKIKIYTLQKILNAPRVIVSLFYLECF